MNRKNNNIFSEHSKSEQRVSNMKDLAGTDHKTNSEITSVIASSNNSHPLDGMAELSFEDTGIVFWKNGERIKDLKNNFWSKI